MKKMIHKILRYREAVVEDVVTGQKEIARYWRLFGVIIHITYEPIEKCQHSEYLGI